MSGCEGLSHSRAGDRGLAKAHSSTEGQKGILTPSSTSSQPRQYKIIYSPSLDDCFSNISCFISSGHSRVGTFCHGRTSLLGKHSEEAALSGLEQRRPQVDAAAVRCFLSAAAFGERLDC